MHRIHKRNALSNKCFKFCRNMYLHNSRMVGIAKFWLAFVHRLNAVMNLNFRIEFAFLVEKSKIRRKLNALYGEAKCISGLAKDLANPEVPIACEPGRFIYCPTLSVPHDMKHRLSCATSLISSCPSGGIARGDLSI